MAENTRAGSAKSNAFGVTQVTRMCALSGQEGGRGGGGGVRVCGEAENICPT